MSIHALSPHFSEVTFTEHLLCPDLKLQVSKSGRAWPATSEKGEVPVTQALEIGLKISTVKHQRTARHRRKQWWGRGPSQGLLPGLNGSLLTQAESHKKGQIPEFREGSITATLCGSWQNDWEPSLLTCHGTSQCHYSAKTIYLQSTSSSGTQQKLLYVSCILNSSDGLKRWPRG